MWYEIACLLAQSPMGLNKHEIADMLSSLLGVAITAKQVYDAINYQWKRENMSIYGDWDSSHTQYIYKIDLDYFDCIMQNQFGV